MINGLEAFQNAFKVDLMDPIKALKLYLND